MANNMERMLRLFEEAYGALITLADEAHVKAEYQIMHAIHDVVDSLKQIEKETFKTEE